MNITVGLGNPGEKYNNTRHNVGFLAMNFLVKEKNLTWQFNKKFNAEIAKDIDTLYIKPMTFMNNSGQAVRAIMSYYKLLPKKSVLPSWLGGAGGGNADLSEVLTVIHDDLDIELSKIKESTDSRAAGHNGVQSIINHLKTKNFKRVRIGIKTESLNNIPGVKYVLQKFNKEEMTIIEKIIKNISA